MNNRIGLLPYGGRQWIAGLIYTHNLIRALNALPRAEQPDLHLLLTPKNSPKEHRELTAVPSLSYYAFRKDWPLWKQAAGVSLSLASMRWPQSLETLIRRREVGILFPAHTSLGQRFPAPWVGWIPDFQHRRLPAFFSAGEREFRDRTFHALAQDASHVVVSSRDAYEDAGRFLAVSSDKFSVLSFAVVAAPEWYEGHAEQVAESFRLPAKYLILPSQFWLHKNHRLVFEAIRMLREGGLPDVHLVCTGHTRDTRAPAHFAGLKRWLDDNRLHSHVHILGLLSRATQVQLMRRAAAVIQPSLFEGWSLLVEDARTLGKRIYLSDIAVHREQDPPDAVFFRADNAQMLADLIARDWTALSPGPDHARENQARAVQLVRAMDFARSFLGMTRLVAARWSEGN
jgi:glycosyltransferase involved in cell wall biosynthesis